MRQSQPIFRRPMLLVCLAIVCGSLLGLSAPVCAETSIESVQIGFAGAHKMGFWTPVWVTLSAGSQPASGRLEIVSLDGSGQDVRSVAGETLQLAAGETATVLRYVKIGRPGKGLTVEFRGSDGSLLRRQVSYLDHAAPAFADADLIVSLGADVGVAEAMSHDGIGGDVTTARLDSAENLPLDWYGYEGVDVLVVTTSDNKLLDQLSLPQAQAIREWVEMGGQLVFCLGASSERVWQAPDNSPLAVLASLVPGTFDSFVTVPNSAPLENYTGGGYKLRFTDQRLRMATLQEPRGSIELFDVGVNGRLPMVVRAPVGFGEVVFVAFDLDQPPLADWAGRPRMIVKIIRGESVQEQRAASQQQSGQVSHVGYHDLVGQLRGALEQFENASFVAFSVVATLILVYILLIGPVDFFFLKNVAGRMQLTWVTFPLVAAAFIVLAVVLKGQLKNDGILVNQVDLIDVDEETGLLRGTTWAHVYSPVTEAYNVEVVPVVARNAGPQSAPAANPVSLISWQGMPGTGLGGLNATGGADAFAPPYTLTAGQASPVIAGLPIQVGSTAAISSRWWQRADWDEPTSLKAGVGDLLQGAVINPLEVELRDCMVFYAEWVYQLERTRGRLAPGQTANAEDERPRNLLWRLTRREVQDMKDIATPWDPASFDVPRIMEMMMFHRFAGGDQYTKLTHRYQDYVDVSSHLKNGRAVLVGRIDQRGTQVVVDGQPIAERAGRHWTFCRIVFPVEKLSGASE